MAITNYSELVTAGVNWFTDRTDLAVYMPDFITLSENVVNFGMSGFEPLRLREMETVLSQAPTAGVVSLPADYLQYRRVVSVATGRRNLEYITPDAAEDLFPNRSGGTPCNFTLVGNELQTFPYDANNIELTYYAKIPALTSVNTTNWLLTKSPSLYLHLVLMQAADFIRKPEEVERQAFICQALMDGLRCADQMGNYARAGVTIRGITP